LQKARKLRNRTLRNSSSFLRRFSNIFLFSREFRIWQTCADAKQNNFDLTISDKIIQISVVKGKTIEIFLSSRLLHTTSKYLARFQLRENVTAPRKNQYKLLNFLQWSIAERFRYSFVCQGTSTRRQRSHLIGLRVKLPPVTTSL